MIWQSLEWKAVEVPDGRKAEDGRRETAAQLKHRGEAVRQRKPAKQDRHERPAGRRGPGVGRGGLRGAPGADSDLRRRPGDRSFDV